MDTITNQNNNIIAEQNEKGTNAVGVKACHVGSKSRNDESTATKKQRIVYGRDFLLGLKTSVNRISPPKIPLELLNAGRTITSPSGSPLKQAHSPSRRLGINDNPRRNYNDGAHSRNYNDVPFSRINSENQYRNYNDNQRHSPRQRHFDDGQHLRHDDTYNHRTRNFNEGFQRNQEDNHYRRHYNDRYRREEQEPEWFSEGPLTHNDTIELSGFQDDMRQEKYKAKEKAEGADTGPIVSNLKDLRLQKTGTDDQNGFVKSNTKSDDSSDISIDKLLGVDDISNLFSNGLLDARTPGGSSRFSQFFQKTLNGSHQVEATEMNKCIENDNVVASSGVNPGPGQAPNPEEIKTKAARDIETALRSILLTKPPDEQEQTNNDMNEFKKMLDQIIAKGGNKPAEPSFSSVHNNGERHPSAASAQMQTPFENAFNRTPNEGPDSSAYLRKLMYSQKNEKRLMDRGSDSAFNENGTTKSIPNLPFQHPMNSAGSGNILSRNEFEMFQERIKKHMRFHKENEASLTANQVLSLLPAEVQALVINTNVAPGFMERREVMQIIDALMAGYIILPDILQQISDQRNQFTPMLVRILKLGLLSVFPIPGLRLVALPAEMEPNPTYVPNVAYPYYPNRVEPTVTSHPFIPAHRFNFNHGQMPRQPYTAPLNQPFDLSQTRLPRHVRPPHLNNGAYYGGN